MFSDGARQNEKKKNLSFGMFVSLTNVTDLICREVNTCVLTGASEPLNRQFRFFSMIPNLRG
jgi:hypothetical protein